jgi:hypothetical protein
METRHKLMAGGAAAVIALLLVFFVVIPFVLHVATLLAVAAVAFIAGEVHGRIAARKQPDELNAPTTPALPGDITP